MVATFYIQQLITSFVASAAFGIIFNVPKKALLQCGFAGMVGWLLYIMLQDMRVEPVTATVVAAFCVTMISHFSPKIQNSYHCVQRVGDYSARTGRCRL